MMSIAHSGARLTRPPSGHHKWVQGIAPLRVSIKPQSAVAAAVAATSCPTAAARALTWEQAGIGHDCFLQANPACEP